MWDQFSRLDEVFAALYFKLGGKMVSKVDESNPDVRFCNDMLGSVSRSFAEVIRQLPKGLCIDILIFYLALRALDTIEDDMEAFKGRETEKFEHLRTFYKTGLVTEDWSMRGVGLGDEAVLLEQYAKVVRVFHMLPLSSQEVIADITRRMGEGMADFATRDLGQGTVTVDDYNLYCHYVAGLVGEGLSRLFASTGYEKPEVAMVSKTLANTMGLFLQKTNILRDYLEDYVDGRAFWPQAIWKQYAQHDDLGEFAKPEALDRAIPLLNHLVTDALHCVPECMQYMDMLKTEEVFRFCAIPQVMAIATLSELYNNPKVFTGVVKIRKGLAVKLILDTTTVGGLHKWFFVFAKDILARVPENDPHAAETIAICKEIIRLTKKEGQTAVVYGYAQALVWVAGLVLTALIYELSHKMAVVQGGALVGINFAALSFSAPVGPGDCALCTKVHLMLFYVCLAYLVGFSIAASGRPALKRADQ
jgi:farnesyl-diphosphate farnesyltransferase